MCSKSNLPQAIIREGFIKTIPFPVPLFFRPSFVYRKGSDAILSFQYEHLADKAHAIAYFQLTTQREAISLPASPFGSIYANDQCTVEGMMTFLSEIKTTLLHQGVRSIVLKHYPACYNQHSHDVVFSALLKSGFEVVFTELNQYLPLDTLDKKAVFDHSKLHLIKKCREAGFNVSISSSFDADTWYEILVRARRLRGHPMTIDLQGLQTLNVADPDCYHFFEVKDGHKIIACAVGVQVTKDVLYYYLAADEDDYRQLSPMTYLLDRLYSFAGEKKIKIIDMGISSSDGIINDGLRWFKKSFGSSEQPKFILEWNAATQQPAL